MPSLALRFAVIVGLALGIGSVPTIWGGGSGAAQAQSLFKALFPRAHERRRARRIERRKRMERDRRAWLRQQKRKRSAARKRSNTRKASARRATTRSRAASRRRAAPAAVAPKPTFFAYQPTELAPINLKKLADKARRDQTALDERAREVRRIARRDRIGRIALASAPVAAAALTFTDAGEELGNLTVRAEDEAGRALRHLYATQPRFVWLDGSGMPNRNARAVLDVLARAGEHALDPDHYAMPDGDLTAVAFTGIDVADAAIKRDALMFELSLTVRAMRYLKDARHGRVTPERLSRYHDFTNSAPNWQALALEIAAANDPARLLEEAHPRHPAYRTLLAALADAKREPAGPPPVVIAPGTFLKPGASNPELANVVEGIRRNGSAELLAKHADLLAAYSGGPVYGKALVALVRDFQKEKGLGADGIVGRNTLAKLVDDTPRDRVGKIRLAIERLRWHPSRFGQRHVFINQPAYRASFMENGQATLSMNVVVGKTTNQTNFFHDEIEYVEFNPYWGIPQSILVNEYLPRLRRDPSYLDRRGYEVVDARGRKRRSSSIDWWSMSTKVPYGVRQKPGPRNALGELKIMFPNDHDIYMHDTPAKKLFAREKRAYSHGCVRLADPRAMAAAVLGKPRDFIAGRIAKGTNNAVKLKQKVPVYVSYFTAWPSAEGEVELFHDVYGRDKQLKRALEAENQERREATRA